MKNLPIRTTLFLSLVFMLVLSACAPQATAEPTAQPAATSAPAVEDATATIEPIIAPSETAVSATETATTTATPAVLLPTDTATPALTSTVTPKPTSTETIGEMLKTHIVFYLLLPDGNRRDACGAIQPEPIISKRLRTGDKIQDVQIALNMLFNVGSKYYLTYYNAMWDTKFTIDNYQYNAKEDYMTIQFGGYFPYSRLSSCDKHGIREQIWTTFFHYGFREKTFKVANGFLIDRLGGD